MLGGILKMRKYLIVFATLAVFLILFSSTCYADENCHDMIHNWYGDAAENQGMPDCIKDYFGIRKLSFTDDKEVFLDSLDKKIQALETERRKGLVEMQKNLNIDIVDADSHIQIIETKDDGDNLIYSIREWVFYDYDDLDVDGFALSVAGFGTNHIITIDKNGTIISDLYDESDTSGVNSNELENVAKSENYASAANGKNQAFNSISLFSTNYFTNYDVNAVANYADTYAINYNTNYANFNSAGGDCANFTSQSILAGGMPQVLCYSGGTDGWYYNSGSDRSGTWTVAAYLRTWMANNRGVFVNNPSASQIYKGSPVFYDWHGDGSWDHATICVGTNSEGTPIVDSHNNDKYHEKWNYGYSDTKHCTVQLTPYNNYINSHFEGHVDLCEGGTNNIRVGGWAFDRNDTSKSIDIHIYIGGPAGDANAEGHAIVANQERTDVNSVYGSGNYHGFSSTISTNKTGNQEVYIYAVNGDNRLLGKYDVNITTVQSVNQAPTYAKLQCSSKMNQVGSNIEFAFLSDYATEYQIYISNLADWSLVFRGSSDGICYSSSNAFSINTLSAGNYIAYITAKNTFGYIDSDSIYFTVFDRAPTISKVESDKNIYQINENIDFIFSSDYATEYQIYISNIANWNLVFRGSEEGAGYSSLDHFTINTLPAGNYTAYITAKNPFGYIDSNLIYFTVYDRAPTDVKVIINKDSFETNEKITFTFSSDCATEYIIYISKLPDWSLVFRGSVEGETYSSIKQYETSSLQTGKYCAYITGKNNFGYMDSEQVFFNVGIVSNDSPHTETQVVKNGNAHNISISQTNLETAKILVGGYKDGMLVSMEILNNDNLQTTFTGDFDTFKVMAWENLSTLKPLCEAETVPQSNWIIE